MMTVDTSDKLIQTCLKIEMLCLNYIMYIYVLTL